jgi:hypothetical protein
VIAFEATVRQTGLLFVRGGALLWAIAGRERRGTFLWRFDRTAGVLFAVVGVAFVVGLLS